MNRALGKLVLVGVLLGGSLQSSYSQQRGPQAPYGWPNAYYPYGYFRPIPESNARGSAPTNPETPMPGGGNFPGQPYAPGWMIPQVQPESTYAPSPSRRIPEFTSPRLTSYLETDSAYVQQTLVLTLEVTSQENMKSMDPVLPQHESLVLRKIGNWNAASKTENGRQVYVNRLNYLVTPLRAGDLTLTQISVAGVSASNRQFSAVAPGPLRLSVRPPEPDLLPWLPLQAYDISARYINDRGVKKGEPLTLVITQNAVGAAGSQLPSPEAQLRTGRFRIYLESSEKSGEVTTDRQLVGSRTDTYTLVPYEGEQFMVPSIRLTWWNTIHERTETSLVPSRMLNAPKAVIGQFSERMGSGPFIAGSSWVFWLPLTIFAFVLGLYWTWIWARSRHIQKRIGSKISVKARPFIERIQNQFHRLSPRRYLHIARRNFANNLPSSYRLWFCVRAADDEDDPVLWSQVLRFLVQRRLGTPAQVPMPQLAEVIVDIHPSADPRKIRDLLNQLNAAVFGGEPIADFNRWKKEFKRQIRPGRFGTKARNITRPTGNDLPILNP